MSAVEIELWILAIAGITSAGGALAGAYFAHRLRMKAGLHEADTLAVRFREPLLQSAFDLQTRFFNIGRLDFFGKFLTSDRATPNEKEYAVRNTAYLVGQYLAWVEIIRRESQYMDPRSQQRNLLITTALERIRDAFATSQDIPDPVIRLFRGEQRAIGEVMLVPTSGSAQSLPRWECKGYAQFVEERQDPTFQRWFEGLEDDLALLGKDLDAHRKRLIRLQHRLVDLIDVLDPRGERVPKDLRERL